MRIFRGPGIMLSPVAVKQPAQLPTLFESALASATTNHCALRDELGAIAYALHEGNAVDEGVKLFSILESEYTLSQKRDDILECIECATPQILRQALFRSGRYFKEHEELRPKFGPPRKVSDIGIAAALIKHGAQTAAAKVLGMAASAISHRIAQAAEDSALYAFKGTFTRGGSPKKTSDDEIAAALAAHDTQTAAAKALGISRENISKRIRQAAEDSVLGVFKGMFKRGATQKTSDDEIAAALRKHGTQKAAATALGISGGNISSRVARASEDSISHAFKSTSTRKRRTKKVSDDELAVALREHGTQTAAAKVFGMATSVISHRIARAVEDSALYVFKGTFKQGSAKKISDAEIAAALRKHDTQVAAAGALGVWASTISKRIRRSAEDSALAVFKGRFKPGSVKKISDDEIATAFAAHDTLKAAATALGVSSQAVSERVARSPEDSALYAFKGTFTRAYAKKITDDEIAAALHKHSTQKAAAAALGVSTSTIYRRIAQAVENSALAIFKGMFGSTKKVSDDEIAAALRKHSTLTAAAGALGVWISTISKRIRRSAPDSALHVFKGTFKAARPLKTSDDEIAAALRKHDTQAAAAGALGVSTATVSKRIIQSAQDSALHVFKGTFTTKGRPKKTSDDEIAAALRKHDTQAAAAEALGVWTSTISKRIKRSAQDSALGTFKGKLTRKGRPKKTSDDEIAAALRKHGTPTAAAGALGIAQSNVSRRAAQATEGSALHAFKGTFKREGSKKVSDDEIAAALREHGTQKAAAAALDISPTTVCYRIAQATEDSALHIFKSTFKLGRYTEKVSDDEIVAALTAHGTKSDAAKALGISQATIYLRIARAVEDSDLYAFKGTFKRGKPKRKKSDDEIAAALTGHGTQIAAAAALGVSQTIISTRIARATEDSALYVFKGTFDQEGRTRKTSDDEIAAALREHGTQTAAAKALGVSNQAVSERVARAPEDSALYVFQGTFKRGRRKQ